MATLLFNFHLFGESSDLSSSSSSANLQLNEQPFIDHRQTADCRSPCNCTVEPSCKAGVNIVADGCGCCPMCARQQGDLCSPRDRCDEEKGLYCLHSSSSSSGAAADFRGTCRAKHGKPCRVDDNEYLDGVQFSPNCSLLCTCQDGKYACSSRCPQELRAPSNVHCRDSHLVAIKDRCCKEWVCPHQHSHIDRDNGTAYDRCQIESTPWSSCSVTCGVGESIRVTTDNADCKPIQERRLCIVRPCDDADSNPLPNKKCRGTFESEPQKIVHEGCESEQQYALRYCATCKRNKCCGPAKVSTAPVPFRCPASSSSAVAEDKDKERIVSKLVMFVEACRCFRQKVCPF